MEVVICVNGWVWEEKEITKNFNTIRILNPAAEVYSLRWQTEELLELGRVRFLIFCDQISLFLFTKFKSGLHYSYAKKQQHM